MTDDAIEPVSSPWKRHRDMLVMSVLAVALSFVLRLNAEGRAYVPGVASHPLPESCPTQRLLGLKCPGCGMTRSFICLAHGEWRESLAYHRLGWLIFAAAALQVPYRLACIYRPLPGHARVSWGKWFAWTLIVLLVGNWLFDVSRGQLFVPLVTRDAPSPAHKAGA